VSQGAHTTPDLDATQLPLPSGRLGMPRGALIFVLIAILCSIMQGSFVVSVSSWNRVWPSIDSTKIQLPPKTF
jgi:hypothetical protein